MTLLNISNFSVKRGQCPVIDNVSLSVNSGEVLGLVGPNGAGKTTLMRAALGLLPHNGQSSLSALSNFDRAKQVAWMPQQRDIAWAIPVRDVVRLGRIAHGNTQNDEAKVSSALERVGMAQFADRLATELSGGEQARILLARALAQDTPLLMADEPIAGLDPAAQLTTMQLFQDLAKHDNRGVVVSLHDLSLAARYCTKIAMLHMGKLHAIGTADEVLNTQNLKEVFHIRAISTQTPQGQIFQPIEVI